MYLSMMEPLNKGHHGHWVAASWSLDRGGWGKRSLDGGIMVTRPGGASWPLDGGIMATRPGGGIMATGWRYHGH